MLILLQPGIEPLGQFDVLDTDVALVAGGETASFQAINFATDGYAADVFQNGPSVQLTLSSPVAGEVYGLTDEGSSTSDGKGYGTMFGTVIGAVVGQGTGHGLTPGVGTVVVGPSTAVGSGKVTLWTKPGLYGVTEDGWKSNAEFLLGGVVNTALQGDNLGLTVGKLTTTGGVGAVTVARSLGLVADASLVSTTATYAGLATPEIDHCALYLFGPVA